MEIEEKIVLLAECLHKLILIELGYGLYEDKYETLREIADKLTPLMKGV